MHYTKNITNKHEMQRRKT